MMVTFIHLIDSHEARRSSCVLRVWVWVCGGGGGEEVPLALVIVEQDQDEKYK